MAKVTDNHTSGQTATKVKLSVKVDEVKVNTWETIINVFRNAFIGSFKLKVDDTIDFTDLV